MMYDGKRFTLGVLKQVLAEFEKRYLYEDMDIVFKQGQVECELKGICYTCTPKLTEEGVEVDEQKLTFEIRPNYPSIMG